MHYVQLVLAWLPGISMNSNENYNIITSRL